MTEHKIRGLTVDREGLARYLERESANMHPLQFYREAIQNEIEAGATKIVIDGFELGGCLLARVSGNGSGMSNEKLISHLATVMRTDKGIANYGIGARIAALPQNPAGVTFASKTANDTGMITLVKQDGVYGLKNWEVTEPDEFGEHVEIAEVILPDDGELLHIKQTGTAVILHGDGKSDTWDNGLAYKVHRYLVNRFYDFPADVKITVISDRSNNRSDQSAGSRAVIPFGQTLAEQAVADGEVPFKDVAGLNGVIFWWLLPKKDEVKRRGFYNDVGYGVGSVVDNEIFDFDKIHLTDFGIHYMSVQRRVVILIGVDGAQMETTRSSVTYPTGKSGDRRNTPWKAFGAYFAEHMPEEIDNLMSKVISSSAIFTDDLAKKLDPDWMKWLQPVKVIVPKKNDAEPISGNENGDALPSGDAYEREDGPVDPEKRRKKLAAHRQGGGDKPGVQTTKVVTPQVKFIAAKEMPEDKKHIHWAQTNNTVYISKEFPPYVREISRWLEKTDHPKSLVTTAVEQAYSIEYAAYIIDANLQRKTPLAAEEIDTLKSSLALYAKALGCQSLTETIGQYLKTVIKAA